MGLETGTYINSLNAANPRGTDAKSAGDDHIRLLKATIKATFPNITGAVTPTQVELNHVAGVTSAIQTQLNGKQVAGSYQPLDATLTALGGTLTAANKILYATALNTAGELDFKDEDNMASNSATAVPSQQSVKAYVDATMALGTAASASGVAVDFVGIASTAKRVTILISALSTNGTSLPIVRLGDSGGFETTGYAGSSGLVQHGEVSVTAAMSSGFIFVSSIEDVTVVRGRVVLEKINGNTWVMTSVMASSNTAVPLFSAGDKTLTGTLTRVRITTTNGTDAFDAGTINIVVE